MSDRWVVVGLARPRSPWFGEVGRWSASATVAIEFLKCVSAPEVRARLASGRPISAVMLDASLGHDRDLISEVTQTGAAAIIVDDQRSATQWDDFGVTGVLDEDFGPDDLVELLEGVAPTVAEIGIGGFTPEVPEGHHRAGRLIAVIGAGGVGTSTMAAGLAQELAGSELTTCLADLALRADQAVLHDARDLVPGVQELCDAHRHGTPDGDAIVDLTFEVPTRNYRLLLGLRRPNDWTSVRPRTFSASLDGLRSTFDLTVADLTGDLSGEDATGSIDIEERNLMARHTCSSADLVVVIGRGDLVAVHRHVELVRELSALGVEASRLVLVSNLAPRRLGQRAEVARALDELLGPDMDPVGPVHVSRKRGVAEAFDDASPLPRFATSAARIVERLLDDLAPISTSVLVEPELVSAGSLGAWTDSEGDPRW